MGVEAVTSPTGATDPAPNTATGGASTGGGAPAGAEPTPAAQPWFEKFGDPSLTEFAVNKGYNKGTLDEVAPNMLRSYQNLEKLVGAEKAGKTVIVPDFEKGDETEMNAFYERIGRPKEGKDYDLALPQAGVNPLIEKFARENFHKAGLTGKQATVIGKAWDDLMVQMRTEETNADLTTAANEDKALKQEWGSAYDNKISLASAAAKSLGVPAEAIEALQKTAGYAVAMKTFANIASQIGEDKFISGEQAGGGSKMTPAEATAELKKLGGDKDWMAAWLDKSHPKHKEAMERKAQLTAWQAGQ